MVDDDDVAVAAATNPDHDAPSGHTHVRDALALTIPDARLTLNPRQQPQQQLEKQTRQPQTTSVALITADGFPVFTGSAALEDVVLFDSFCCGLFVASHPLHAFPSRKQTRFPGLRPTSSNHAACVR